MAHTHAVEPALGAELALQAVHAVCAGSALKKPGAQAAHVAAPEVVWPAEPNCPGAQTVPEHCESHASISALPWATPGSVRTVT